MMRIAGAFLGLLFMGNAAFAQSEPATLARDAAIQLEAAHRALDDAKGARDRVAALTQTIGGYEDGLDALRDGLRRAAIRESAIRLEFEAESERVSRLLGVLLNIQSASGPLLLLHPSGPLGTARSGMIVSDITPAFQKQAAELREKLEEVALLRVLQQSAANSLQDGLRGVQRARTQLSKAISNRTDLPQRFLSDPAQVQRLIESTETLDGFASGLAQIDIGDAIFKELQGFSQAKGTLTLPVSGKLLRAFNEADAAGIRRPGLLIATRPLALVTTPWPATLRYRGPLLDYGNVMILEPTAGTLLILAGLDQVYGEVGQVLPSATALGLMGGEELIINSFLPGSVNGTGSELTETLYIELRINEEPLDPTQWFVETKD